MRFNIRVVVGLVVLFAVSSSLTYLWTFRGLTVLTGGEGVGRGDHLELVMSVEDVGRRMGEPIIFTFTLRNLGDENFSCRMGLPLFDINLYDEAGGLLARWSDGRAFIEVLLQFELPPGGEYSEEVVWDMRVYNPETGETEPLAPGSYSLSGVWLGETTMLASIETSKIPLKVARRIPSSLSP